MPPGTWLSRHPHAGASALLTSARQLLELLLRHKRLQRLSYMCAQRRLATDHLHAGASAPVRVVNSGEVTSIGPSGGTANFTLSILPNISTNASSSNSSNSTPAWAVTPLDWTSVFVNGQRCVALPSRSLGLPGCGLSYSDLAAGGGAGAPGTESATVTTDRGGVLLLGPEPLQGAGSIPWHHIALTVL